MTFPDDGNTNSKSPVETEIKPEPVISTESRFDLRASNSVSEAVLKLGHDIGTAVLRKSTDKAFVISPISIASALSLVLLGAKGETHQELMRLMGYDYDSVLSTNPYKIHEEFGNIIEDLISEYQTPIRNRPTEPWKEKGDRSKRQVGFNFPQSDQYPSASGTHEEMRQADPGFQSGTVNHKIAVANGIFIQNDYSLRPDYKTVVESVYRSEIKSLDFERNSAGATQYINSWVRQKTNNKIKNILNADLPQDTQVVLASALYFKALWEDPFFTTFQ